MKKTNRFVVTVLLMVISVVLCSCGGDHRKNLPGPFSDLHPDMTKDEVRNKFASLGIKDATLDTYSDSDVRSKLEIENIEIEGLLAEVTFYFDPDDKLTSCVWSKMVHDDDNIDNRDMVEIQMAFMESLGVPKEGFSTDFNRRLTWRFDRENYEIESSQIPILGNYHTHYMVSYYIKDLDESSSK